MWVETVTEGGRRFTTGWRKEEIDDAARHRQEEKKDATRIVSHTEKRRILRSDNH